MEKEAKTYRWQVSEEMLREIVEVIRKEVDPEMIIMFGSRARGEGREDSDVDLIVIEKEPFGEQRSRLKELYKINLALFGFRVPIDVILYSRAELQKYQDSLNNVLGRGWREGKILYERH